MKNVEMDPKLTVISDRLRVTSMRLEGWRHDWEAPKVRIYLDGDEEWTKRFLRMVTDDMTKPLREILSVMEHDKKYGRGE